MASNGALRVFVEPRLKELPRIILIALFGFAAIDKLAHLSRFAIALHSYHLLPEGTERYAALFIVMAEMAIAIGLITRRWRSAASLSAALLLVAFTAVYIIAAPEDTCGCWFTLTLAKGGSLHVLQNVVFIGLAVLVWIDSRSLAGTEKIPAINSEVNSASSQSRSDGEEFSHTKTQLHDV